MMRRLIGAFLVVAVVVAGCGDDDDDTATPTTAPSGTDEAATTGSADFDVVFDGETCTVTGPDAVPAGSYTFVLTDTSGFERLDLEVDAYLDGNTYADVEELIAEAGGDGAAVAEPEWAQRALIEFGAPSLDLAEDQTQFDHVLEAGPHGMVIAAISPIGAWGCAGLEVT